MTTSTATNPTTNPATTAAPTGPPPVAPTRRGVTEQAAVAAIESGTRVLRLPTMRDRFAEVAAAAQRDALGTASAEAGHRVRYTLASKLVNELVEAADEKQLSKTIARYGRADLLCLDELGYMELDRRGAELLFQVLTEREERSAVAIASNEALSGWTKTFTDPRLSGAAIVDRLTFAGQIIETSTTSYRLAHARAARRRS